MVTVLLVIALAVFAAMITRATENNKREEIRIPIENENRRIRRRR